MKLHVNFTVVASDLDGMTSEAERRLAVFAPDAHWRIEIDIAEGASGGDGTAFAWVGEVHAYRETSGSAAPRGK